jgi:hypothetical protein
VIDAHNVAAGIEGLAEIAQGLSPEGAERGSRSAPPAIAMTRSCMARLPSSRGADHVVIAELRRYLRGREADDLVRRLWAGAVDGGAAEVPAMPDEIAALRHMLDRSGTRDVLAITVLAQRPEMFALLDGEMGARRADAETVRTLVGRGRRPA